MALSLFLSCYWILEYLGIFFFSFQKTYWVRARLSTAGLIHLTWNADLVAAINGDLWAEMEKLLYFSIIAHLHAPAPPTIQGCGPAHLLSFGKRKRDIHLKKKALILNPQAGLVVPGSWISLVQVPQPPRSAHKLLCTLALAAQRTAIYWESM